jgi:hypothetical protein
MQADGMGIHTLTNLSIWQDSMREDKVRHSQIVARLGESEVLDPQP